MLMHFLIFGVLATYSFGAYVVGDTLGHWFIVDLWPNLLSNPRSDAFFVVAYFWLLVLRRVLGFPHDFSVTG